MRSAFSKTILLLLSLTEHLLLLQRQINKRDQAQGEQQKKRRKFTTEKSKAEQKHLLKDASVIVKLNQVSTYEGKGENTKKPYGLTVLCHVARSRMEGSGGAVRHAEQDGYQHGKEMHAEVFRVL